MCEAIHGLPPLRVATAGSVDDGKSTLIGRLLYDAKALHTDQLEHLSEWSRRRGLPERDLALVTDGLPTDDFQAGLNHLLSKPWGRQAMRIVVAIGEDSASNEAQEIFRAFMANEALKPFHANNPEALAEQIRWVSTAVLKSVSSPAGQKTEPVAGATAAGWTASLPLMTGMEKRAPDEADVW